MTQDRYYLTTPIYYVNDVPHVGHAYTSIAGDVLARWNRLQDKEVFYLTGTDEHGTKIAQAAAAHNKEPQAYCDEIAAQFQQTWKELDITNDQFIRTTSPAHHRAVQHMLKLLWDKGLIYKGSYSGKYCVQCERFYTDDELRDGLCPDHRIKPEAQSEDNYFFRLSEFQNRLLDAITDENHPNHFKIYPLVRRNEIIGKLKTGLNDLSISRATLTWGIPLPWDRSQTTYVWGDALVNYLTALGYPDEKAHVERWWPADLHLMAKDILWFHAVVWPAMLLAAGLPLPRKLFIHGFFTVNGQKMSKSLGNVIRPAQLVETFGVDGTRYLLLSAFPFGADGDFSLETMQTGYNAALANDLGNLVSRSLTMLEKYAEGVFPDGPAQGLADEVLKTFEPIPTHMDHLAFHQILAILWVGIDRINRFIEEKAPWKMAKTAPQDVPLVLKEVLVALKMVMFYLWPFMPNISQNIWRQLGETADFVPAAKTFFDEGRAPTIPAGQRIQKQPPLFPRKA